MCSLLGMMLAELSQGLTAESQVKGMLTLNNTVSLRLWSLTISALLFSTNNYLVMKILITIISEFKKH